MADHVDGFLMVFNVLGNKFRKLFQLKCSARKLAFAAALGVLIGMSPYIGLHTAIALGASFIFQLPMYPLILGAYITNPLTIVFIYAFCYKVGLWVLHEPNTVNIDWMHLSSVDIFHSAKTILIPFFVGTHLVGLVFAIITYFVIYCMAVRYKENT